MEHESVESYFPLQQNNYGSLRKFVVYYKKHLLRLPEAMLEAGVKLIKNFKGKLGDDYYLILEDIFHAAIECQQFGLAKIALTKLREKFEDMPRVLRIVGIYHEASGEKQEAEALYDHILEENPLNLEIRKRKIALLRTDGESAEAIVELNKYLQENLCDKEAWLELADIYLENLNYQKALYCYEQACLLAPKNMHYFIRCAEILYTLGGQGNLALARNYYTFALHADDTNTQAMFGLIKTCKALEALKKGDAKNKELLALGTKALRSVYEKTNPALLEFLPL